MLCLKNREFPIGSFIRDLKDLGYTPAPDVFHDLYGHLPFLANPEYSDFLQHFGETASPYIHDDQIRRQFERLFWFLIEFSIIHTPVGKRVLGAGLASSVEETLFALSDQPEVTPFDIETIRFQEFKIDEFQKRIFILNQIQDLYRCLDTLDLNHKQKEEII